MSYPLKTKRTKPSEPVAASSEQIAASREKEYWKAVGGGENLTTWQKAEGDGWRKWDLSPCRKQNPTRARGSRCGSSKLKESDIDTICQAYSHGDSSKKIAKSFGVLPNVIMCIINGKTWNHVPRQVFARSVRASALKGECQPRSKLNEAKILEIRQLYASGKSAYALAKLYGVTDTVISKIIKKLAWKHVPDFIPHCKSRGRMDAVPRGESSGRAKLTEQNVREIRQRSVESHSVLAKEFAVNRSTISNIIARTSWKHVLS